MEPESIFEGGTFGGILRMRFPISLLCNDLSIDVNPSLKMGGTLQRLLADHGVG